MTGIHKDAVDHCIEQMFSYDPNIDVAEKQDMFWTEYSSFEHRNPPFDKKDRQTSHDGDAGRDHLWHKKDAAPFTKVLGLFCMRVCSKVVGIGSCERAWRN